MTGDCSSSILGNFLWRPVNYICRTSLHNTSIKLRHGRRHRVLCCPSISVYDGGVDAEMRMYGCDVGGFVLSIPGHGTPSLCRFMDRICR